MAAEPEKTVEALVGRPFTAEYEPAAMEGIGFYRSNATLPPFTPHWIPYMLRDSRVQFGLRMIKGPILSASRFYIDDPKSSGDKHSPLKKFVIRNLTRFWRESAVKALRAIEWGYSGHEALYKLRHDLITFDALKVIQPKDVKVLTKDGNKVGISVQKVKGRRGKVYLGGPKGLWHVVGREENPWYGTSRLTGCFGPWLEFYDNGGAKDVRRLYYHKYAFAGETGYYPPGHIPGEDGSYGRSGKEVMRSILEKRKTGGVIMFPNTYDSEGRREWELLPATTGPGGIDVLQYHSDLKKEIFEGMGIPSEVVEAAQVGSGWSGRRVPESAFFSMLQELVNWLVYDFNQQVLLPLVELNYGISEPDYEIIPFGLAHGSEGEEEQEQGQPQPPPEPETPNVPEDRQKAAKFSICV